VSGLRASAAALGARRPFAGFAFLFLASTATSINYSAPSVIFDPVMRDLQMSPATVTFIQTLFIGCLGGSLILAGSLGDEIGKKRLCLRGLAIMMAADLGAALAPSGGVLLLARAVQGIGMAAFLSTMVALCSALFADPRQKALAFSLFGASVGLSVISSNLVGEWCLTYLSWRWLFLLVVPLLLLPFAGILLLVPEQRPQAGPLRFDGVGAVLLAASVLSLIVGLSEGPRFGWGSSISLGFFVTAGASFALFNLHQVRRARQGLYIALDYGLFQSPGFAAGVLSTFLYFAGALGVMQIWPSALPREIASLTAIDLAYIMAGMGITFTVMSLAASSLSSAIGARNLVVLAIAVNLVCLGSMIGVVMTTGTIAMPLLATLLIIFGGGYGVVFTKLTYLAVAPVSPERASSASGILLSARQTSTAIGAALLAALVQSTSSFALLNGAACVLMGFALVASFFLKDPFKK
jgi:MFS family permease